MAPGVFAGVAQLVELQFSKLNVIGSNPIARYTHPRLGDGSVLETSNFGWTRRPSEVWGCSSIG